LYRASVKPHEMLHEGETDPQSARGAIERGVDLHESVEDLREVLGRDADLVIPHADDDLPVAPRFLHAQPDVTVRRGELRGIAQQVAEDLLETKGIRLQDHRLGGKGQDELLLALLQVGPEGLDRSLHHPEEIDRLLAELDPTESDPGDVEELVDHARHGMSLAIHDVSHAI